MKHLSTPLSHCNDEMGLQCYVVTTTLQKGGGGAGGTKRAEFSKVFLSEIVSLHGRRIKGRGGGEGEREKGRERLL